MRLASYKDKYHEIDYQRELKTKKLLPSLSAEFEITV